MVSNFEKSDICLTSFLDWSDRRRLRDSMSVVHRFLALAVIMALISVLRVTTVDRSVQVLEGLGYEVPTAARNVSTSTSSPSPPSLPLWTDKLRPSENFTGYRYIQDLKVNAPFKVSSSVNIHLYKSWIQLPLASNSTQQHTVHTNFSFAVIRDPLERLYSGYYNKCIKSAKTAIRSARVPVHGHPPL